MSLNNLGYNSPVKIISGNHDRKFYNKIDFSVYENVEFSKCNFIRIIFQSENTNQTCFLTHDGGNGIWLPLEFKRKFVMDLKVLYEINQNDWLISGHTHTPFIEEENKLGSLGCFNFDSFKHHQTVLSFGILEWNNISLQFSLHDLGETT